MKKINKITVNHIIDDCADTSFLGKYTDDIEEGVIIREFNEFYENLTEEQKEEIPSRGREYRCFKPYAGGENPGTEDFYKYGKEDYKRMEDLNKGRFCFIGIKAKAEIYTSKDGKTWLINSFSSGGLWGIESDSGEDYIKQIEEEQIDDLKDELLNLGFIPEDFNNIEVVYKRF